MRRFNSSAISFVLICLISVATTQELIYEPVDTFTDSAPDQWGSGIPVIITTNGNKATSIVDTIGQDFQGHGLPTRVVCGQTITEDTTLDEDLTCSPGTEFAIAIGASNITLDLGRHVLRGYAPGTGVVADGYEGITIRNGTIEGFNEGVVIFNTPGATVENLTVRNQDDIDPDHLIVGIHIDSSQDVVVRDMLFEFPSVAHKEAIDIYESDVAVTNIEVRGGGVGVNFSFAGACGLEQRQNTGTVLNSWFSGIAIAGIWVACSSNVRIAGNVFTTAPGVGVGITGDAPISGAVTGLTVEGNYIHDAVSGIEFRGIIESFISNNIITDNLLWGIAIRPSLGCLTGEPGYECFYSTANVIADNEALGNGTDLYHHEDCGENIWGGNTCETKQGADIPECTPTLTSTLLLIKYGAGSGTIVSSPAGVDCGGVCFASFPNGVSVTLTATPDTGTTFTGWSGSGCSGTGTCTVTMDAAKVVTATFDWLPTLTVTSPNGGESWAVGSNQTITWTSAGTVGNVKIEYTTNNGINWNTVISSTSNSGIYSWTVPSVSSTNCKVKISETDGSPSDTSDSVFTIVSNLEETSPPFGFYATPIDGANVSSSIAVTGWALDDSGIDNVKIYRMEGKTNVYIGDATLVEGARPDVAAAYPQYPFNTKAGWGYMMLTNFLPNGGNGTFIINAIATDIVGKTTTLGSKTITVDNANAVKPFGAIDTPTQGGSASGSGFINWGWVLTPQPNNIRTDGSTINVFVDGINIGHPTYNIYREDIAGLFPGYANSNGAVGYLSFDTTTYANGVHTIYWTATDSGGNIDGIGSRFFSSQNTGGASDQAAQSQGSRFSSQQITDIPVDYNSPVRFRRGFDKNSGAQLIRQDDKGICLLNVRELERIELQLAEKEALVSGYLLSGDNLRPLPIGSTIKNGSFYWTLGPGFYGDYRLVFVVKDNNGALSKREVVVKIVPRFNIEK